MWMSAVVSIPNPRGNLRSFKKHEKNIHLTKETPKPQQPPQVIQENLNTGCCMKRCMQYEEVGDKLPDQKAILIRKISANKALKISMDLTCRSIHHG